MNLDAANPLFGTTSFYEFNKILAGACMGFACLVILLHLANHAMHLSDPSKQVKYDKPRSVLSGCQPYNYLLTLTLSLDTRIMRVTLLVPLYSIICFLCLYFPSSAVYLRPWLDVAQSNCLATYFLLLCEYVSPHADQRDLFWSTIDIKDKLGTKKSQRKVDGVRWFRVRPRP